MDLISTHIHADFDALASMVAAGKLYPRARLLFPGSQERNVREFLRETCFPLRAERLRGFPLDAITRLILVDVKRAARIGPLAALLGRGLDVHIYDHHPAHPKDIAGSLEVVRDVGATTTILIGLLKEHSMALTPPEATLLALGIYEETGFLTFTNTSEADFQAAAHCLASGANLSLATDFIRRELTAEQVGLLNALIHAAETHSINGIRVVVSTASLDRYVGDLAMLVHKLRDMENINVLFALVRMDNRIHLVARSRLEAVDVGRVVEAFGGGGHATAASAAIKDLTLYQAKDRLLELLHDIVRPLTRARDVLTAPVKTIAERATIQDAAGIMNRFSLAYLPVIRGGDMVGLLTRENVDKAIYHGLGDAPVPDYMSREFAAVNLDTPLPEVQRLMVERSLGFLPVLSSRRLHGAVTRADVLRANAQELLTRATFDSADRETPRPAMGSVANLLGTLPGRIQALLHEAGAVADAAGTRVYVVGGFVRDLLLQHENLDVDLVVEGDGIAFAEQFGTRVGGKVTGHRKFGTALLRLPDGFPVDVATARTEYYEAPAALPTVEHGSIKMDLYRRDFTVNALAVCLNSGRYGDLLDFFGGQQDLRDRTLRLIHNLSFVEDPTRILRAARFESRFGLHLSRHAEQLITNAVRMGLLDKLAGGRIFTELTLVLQESDPWPILRRLAELGVLAAIHPRLVLGKTTAARFARAAEVLTWYRLLYLPVQPVGWQVYLLVWFEERAGPDARAILRRLAPSSKVVETIGRGLTRLRALARTFARARDLTPSRSYRLLSDVPLEVVLALMAVITRPEPRKAIGDFVGSRTRVRPFLRGDDLQALGIRPGPIYRDILNSLLYAKLDGQVQSRDDELRFVQQRFAQALPPSAPARSPKKK